MDSGDIRQQLRTARRSLASADQKKAAKALTQQLISQTYFLQAKHIGLYLANDGEIDPHGIIEVASSLNIICYLPVIDRATNNSLCFAEYDENTELKPNKFNILEPVITNKNSKPPKDLDLILMPLVGFDREGNRIGMGGGYYDRTLAFMNTNKRDVPTLIGLAHSCQEISSIDRQSWDITLNLIVTEKQIICAKPR
ncbi:MAG: 5-formyltetrahydrofolate cyclo-ligase [Porticoccaceae bacterium]|nr:5-formyltetrahydrofolate cyclo-ligase [Porticoccaceae bacterium]